MSFETVTIGPHTLYRGDCLEVLPTLGKVDAVVTDPPYGVNLEYESYDDSFENWKKLIDTFLPMAKNICRGPIIVPTSKIEGEPHLHSHSPIWRICWFKGASCTRSAIGFKDWEPTFVFGKAPQKQVHDYFTAHANMVREEVPGHPCPKPYAWANWLVEKMSEAGEVVLDPFMGSGTTGVACQRLGRTFIGIEKEPKYFDIACKRIEAEMNRFPMFETPVVKQESLLEI
jgi:site-specific DNA-methyltransferase (adenine-specific)/modification methylase